MSGEDLGAGTQVLPGEQARERVEHDRVRHALQRGPRAGLDVPHDVDGQADDLCGESLNETSSGRL